MSHYRSNLRDIEFNLFEVFGTGSLLGTGPFALMDAEVARDVLREVERLATGPFASSFVEGDRTGLRLEDGDVVLPPGIKRSLDAYYDGEWFRVNLPPHLGGVGAPPSLAWACSELLMGANPAAFMYCASANYATIVDPLVTPEQRGRWVLPMVEHNWGATMVLTEPDAGSDVGAARTTATDNGDGTWSITGVKRFITNGDFDWPSNVLHLVLARPEGAGPGTKGLSLYIVPKHWVAGDGSLGERNRVHISHVEDKMGLKANAACELTFDRARGVLVGDVHDGIRQMFKVIQYARMLVSAKAVGTLSTAYLNALAYARQRVQGPDLSQAADRTAPRVEIIRHPDVRRMLMDAKAHGEGMRALLYYAASLQDEVMAGEAAGQDVDHRRKLNDLLLPMLKGYTSEKCYELLSLTLQVFGGSGYCRDYPIEQYIRDAKVDTLYEGTTGIQALDLFFRKIGKDQGATLGRHLEAVGELAKSDAGNGALQGERERLARALDDVQGMAGAMVGHFGQHIYLVGLNTTPFLFALTELTIGWLLLRQAEVALAALDGDVSASDRAFYEGKVAAARWFARTVLPKAATYRTVAESSDLALMDMADEAF